MVEVFLKVILSIYIVFKIRSRVIRSSWAFGGDKAGDAFWRGAGAIVPSVISLWFIWWGAPAIFRAIFT